MKTDAVYARQSVEKKDSLSIAGQIDLCRRTAGGGELRVYKDAGYSGKNTERPAFQQLMKDIRADRIGTLYVYRLDRFSRSVADFGQLWEVLQEHHVEFVSVNENFDTKTPMGRAMLHIIMVFAQRRGRPPAERVRGQLLPPRGAGRVAGRPSTLRLRQWAAPGGGMVGKSRPLSPTTKRRWCSGSFRSTRRGHVAGAAGPPS